VNWESASLGDSIGATGTSVNGASDPVDAVWADCASPPNAEIQFTASGNDELVMCLTGTSVSLGLDFSGSAAGAEALAFYHLFDGQNGNERSVHSTASLSVGEVGVWIPELMVVDSGACGALVDAVLWAGENDGSVAGPVSISTSHSSLVSGSSTQGTATLTVSAEDCAGDVASGESLVARVNLGTLDPTASVLTDTGFGQAMILDSTGGGQFDLSVAGSSFAGEAVVAVGNVNGSAYGEVVLSVSGDNAQPTVAWVDPSGTTAEQLNVVAVQFSEAMEISTLNANNVALVDANGSAIDFSLSLEAGNSRLVFQLDSLLDAATETVVLSLSADTRDSAGNFLDGDLSGNLGGSEFLSTFGNVQDDGLVLQSCTFQDAEFVPDGDASAIVGQADEAEIALTSSARGEMWLLEVFDSNGDRVRTHRESTTGVSTSLFWDGRGDAGLLLDPETYLLSASVEDPQGNIAAACQATVQLNQSYTQPERQE